MAAWTHIAHDSLSLPASSVTWSSIPSSYDHLYLEASMRSDRVAHEDQFYVQLNNVTTTGNYSTTRLTQEGSTIDSGRYNTNDYGRWVHFHQPAASALADTFGALTMWLPNYANTANFKQAFISSSAGSGSGVGVAVTACLFHSTSAVDQITVTPLTGPNIVQYSTFTLYGVTGA